MDSTTSTQLGRDANSQGNARLSQNTISTGGQGIVLELPKLTDVLQIQRLLKLEQEEPLQFFVECLILTALYGMFSMREFSTPSRLEAGMRESLKLGVKFDQIMKDATERLLYIKDNNIPIEIGASLVERFALEKLSA